MLCALSKRWSTREDARNAIASNMTDGLVLPASGLTREEKAIARFQKVRTAQMQRGSKFNLSGTPKHVSLETQAPGGFGCLIVPTDFVFDV